jgi:hypothetical protein
MLDPLSHLRLLSRRFLMKTDSGALVLPPLSMVLLPLIRHLNQMAAPSFRRIWEVHDDLGAPPGTLGEGGKYMYCRACDLEN